MGSVAPQSLEATYEESKHDVALHLPSLEVCLEATYEESKHVVRDVAEHIVDLFGSYL